MSTETEREAPTIPTDGEIVGDFADIDTKTPSEQGRPLHFRSGKSGKLMYLPDGSKVTITFAGPDSEAVRAIARRNTDEMLAAYAESNGKGRGKTDSDAKTKRTIDDLASLARAWNVMPIDGETLAFSVGNVKKLLSNPRWGPSMVEQAVNFVFVRESFFGAESSS